MMIGRICLAALLVAPVAAGASEIQQTTIESAPVNISVSQVSSLHVLRDRPGLRVQVVIQDIGGSTDMSPTLHAYLAIYAKGEICSMDAVFDLGAIYSIKSARRMQAGQYELVVDAPVSSPPLVQETVLQIDARQAVIDVDRAPCAEHETSDSIDTKITVGHHPK